MESEKAPKDRGSMVTSAICSKLTEGSDDCGDEGVGKTAELHNGGEQVGTSDDSMGDLKTKKKENENTKTTDALDSEYASNTDEKWQLHLDLSDSASTSDNDGSEVEANERNGGNLQKQRDNSSPSNDADDSKDFLGFEMGAAATQDSGMVLTKLIGLAESALKCDRIDPCGASTSHDFKEFETRMGDNDTEMKLAPCSVVSLSKIFFDYDNEMDVEDCESIKFTLKLLSNADMLRLKEEAMDEDSSSRDNMDDLETGVVVSRSSQPDGSLFMTKGVKIYAADNRSPEVRKKKRKKAKEKDKLKENEYTGLMDMKMYMDVSTEVSSSADIATPMKAEFASGVGAASEDMSSEVTSSAASSPSVSSRSSFKMSGSGGRYCRGDSPALSSSGGKGKKIFMDLSDPAFLKPFEYGWKRELVYRSTNESASKKMADIYYYTPTGKKVRSNREVLEHLDSGDLTIENFTFCKEVLGLNDPTKEIIRDAKKILSKDPNATPTRKTTKLKSKKSSPLPEALSSSPLSLASKGSQHGRTVPPKAFPKIKVSSVKLQRLPIGKGFGVKQKKNETSEDGEMEIGMLPPMWSPSDSPFLKKSTGSPQTVSAVSWSAKDAEDVSKGKHMLAGHESDGPPAKRSKSSIPPQGDGLEKERHFMQYFMMNVCAGYSSLLHVFQYLKVQELLRAARVCRMWHDMASHPSLWRTVRMKNSHVGDWEGLVKSLRRHETQHLDLRKMLVPNEDTHSMWDEFCCAIVHATGLSRLDLCRCPARVVERVAESCPQLKIINALSIKCSNINLQCVGNHRNLQELRLKSLSGIHLSTTLAALKQLSSLKHLSLTTFKELGKMEPSVLGFLKNLESLELGECCDLPPEFGPESLSRLKKLERLRLEKGQGKDCPTFSILAGIAVLPKLTHLELVNFDVKPGFDKALAQCTNIRRLLIIPTYVTQSATTNHMVLNGVNHLCDSLTHFVWGVTHELLRVTELFVDQCEGQKDNKTPPSKAGKKSSGSDSIPILKPIQIKDDCQTEKLNDQENEIESNRNGDTKTAEDSEDRDESDDAKASAAAPQVEILPLPKLQKLLTSSLPKTRVKILKIPFHATWRQTISEPAP